MDPSAILFASARLRTPFDMVNRVSGYVGDCRLMDSLSANKLDRHPGFGLSKKKKDNPGDEGLAAVRMFPTDIGS